MSVEASAAGAASASSSSSVGWWKSFSSMGKKDDHKSHKKDGSGDVMVALVGLFLELGAIVVTSYVASILISKLLKQANASSSGDSEENEAALSAAEKRLQYLLVQEGRSLADIPPLTNYERQIAQDVIDPNDITIQFADIGGIDDMKQELWELAVLPLQRPDLFRSSHLLQAPGGILLYGPPGTGKTMLAKAIAKEANATFIAVKLSKIMNKWFGESNKLIDAIFSLARKLAPSVIFVDELDTFLNPRDGSENSAGNAIKAEFLTLWDGITTSQSEQPVMVLGATNRPNQVDSAILRRLPRLFRIELPNAKGRLQILKLTLKDHPLDESATKYLPLMAQNLKGYSGSDLKELCHCAALESVREIMREHSRQAVMVKTNSTKTTTMAKAKAKPLPLLASLKSKSTSTSKSKSTSSTSPDPLRPMSKKDLVVAQTKVKRTGQDAAEYERKEFEKSHDGAPAASNSNNQKVMMQSMAALARLLQQGDMGGGAAAGKDNDDDDEDDDDDDDLIPQIF